MGKDRKWEVEKCDCQSWINQERTKYEKDKAEDLEKYNTLTDLIDGINALKDKQKWDDKETYKNREIGYIVKNLEKDRGQVSSMISYYQKNLTQLDQWEYELNEKK